MANRVVMISEGRLVYEGDVESLRTGSGASSDVPLIDALPTAGTDRFEHCLRVISPENFHAY